MLTTCRLGSLLRAGALGYVGLGAVAGSLGAWLGALLGVIAGSLYYSRAGIRCALPRESSPQSGPDRDPSEIATGSTPS